MSSYNQYLLASYLVHTSHPLAFSYSPSLVPFFSKWSRLNSYKKKVTRQSLHCIVISKCFGRFHIFFLCLLLCNSAMLIVVARGWPTKITKVSSKSSHSQPSKERMECWQRGLGGKGGQGVEVPPMVAIWRNAWYAQSEYQECSEREGKQYTTNPRLALNATQENDTV